MSALPLRPHEAPILTLFRREQQSPGSTPAPPALSPSAIVGLAIIGGIFFCVALAAMLHMCLRPSPQDSNPTSLYQPEDAAQLARMKEVREYHRRAAWESAEAAHAEQQSERRASWASTPRPRASRMGGWRERRGVGASRLGQTAQEAYGEVELDEQWSLHSDRLGERDAMVHAAGDYGAGTQGPEALGDRGKGRAFERYDRADIEADGGKTHTYRTTVTADVNDLRPVAL